MVTWNLGAQIKIDRVWLTGWNGALIQFYMHHSSAKQRRVPSVRQNLGRHLWYRPPRAARAKGSGQSKNFHSDY